MNKNIQNLLNNNKDEMVMIPTRKGFGEGLFLAGKEIEKVVALCADLTESTQVEIFKNNFPKRYFEIGVAEQNMASVASGMAAMGKIPFIASYAMFSPGRNWEQIRTTIAYNNVPVKIIGAHAGVSVGPDGGTHQALEDVSIMRAMPNMIVVVPCDAIQAKKATLEIAKNNKPSYMRIFREKSPLVTEEESDFKIGIAEIIYESDLTNNPNPKKVGIIACGEMVAKSLKIVRKLEEEGIDVGILNLHTIKPIDGEKILEWVLKYKNILTIEEHQVAGGMGSAVLEEIARLSMNHKNIFSNLQFKMLGVQDRFGQSGTKDELFKEYGLDEENILKNAKSFF